MNLEKMKLGKELDKALYYAAYALNETGTNSKPVLLHSSKSIWSGLADHVVGNMSS